MLPRKLNKDTIIDSIVELRFDTDLPKSVIFGILYNELKDEFPVVEEKPIASLPEKIRSQDPTMVFQALYSVKNDKFVVQIGTNMIAISCFPNYLGWEEYTATCFKVLKKVYNLGIISKVSRIGIRYINRFEGDISKDTNVSLNVNNIEGKVSPAHLVFHIGDQSQTYGSLVQYRLELVSDKITTIIDIDTSTEIIESSTYDYICGKIEEGHNIEKKIFFDLLKPQLIDSLEPTY